MNNNSFIKSILTVVFLIAVYAYSRYTGGTLPTPSPPTPTITVDKPTTPDLQIPSEEPESRSNRPPPNSPSSESANAPKRDLEQDEKHHGHTLQRHVGRSDEQLLERLQQETDISSASTYTDKNTAERIVGMALEKNKSKIDAWIHQGSNRPNLAFDFFGDGKTPIGRSIRRGKSSSQPCYGAKVVLKADGDSFHVLTSYPEAR